MTNIGGLREILSNMMKEIKEELESSKLPFQIEVCTDRLTILKKCYDDLGELGVKIGKRFLFEAQQFDLKNYLGEDHPLFKGGK